jgi:hypothetical protein
VKKLIFMLLFALAFAVFATAEAAQPPWDANLEAALSGDGVENYAVIPDTVLAVVPLSAEQPTVYGKYGVLAVRQYHAVYLPLDTA